MAAPPPSVYFEDGTPVPPDQIAAALQSGQAFVDRTQPVHMVDDTGVPVRVDPGELDKAIARGYAFEGSDTVNARQMRRERTTGGQLAATAAEGAARGATLGLSDAALTGVLGDDYRQGALERRQVNPGVAAVGEVGGTLAATLASGGLAGTLGAPARAMAGAGRLAEGAAMSGARALGYEGATLAGRATARALALGAAGGVEGAMYGAGQAVSKAALEGTPVTAEKVVASMGEGALFGGLAGGALGAVGQLAPAAGRALLRGGEEGAVGLGRASSTLRERARELADTSALKALGARGSDLRRLGKTAQRAEQEIGEIGQEVLSYRFKTGPRQGEKLFQFASKAEDFVDDLAHARGETGEALGALRGEVDNAIRSNPELAPDLGGYLRRVDEEVLAPLRASASPTVRRQANRVERELSLLRERVQPQYEVDGLRFATAEDAAFATEVKGVPAVEVPPEPVSFADLDQFRRDLRSVFQPPKPTSGGLPPPVPEHAQYLERAERILSDELDNAAESALAKMGRDPSEYSQLKEQFRNLRQAEDIAGKAALQDLGNRAISPSDYATGMATGLGALMSGNVGAMALGAAGTIAHKLIRERGRSVVALLADRVAKVDSQIGAAVPRLLGTAAAPTARALMPTALSIGPRWEQLATAVREYQRDPQAAQARLAAPVRAYADDYPQLAGAVQQQIAKTYDFLSTKLPKPLTRAGASLTPELERTRYQAAEIAKFSRFARGAVSPQEVVKDLASGRVDRDGIEAIKTLYPETFSQLRSKVISEIGTLKEPLPFQRRMLLSLVFDFNGDASLDPAFTSAVQQAHAEQIQQEAAQQASMPPPQISDRLAEGSALEGV